MSSRWQKFARRLRIPPLLLELVRERARLVVLIFSANLGSAVFEGSTMAIIALILRILMAGDEAVWSGDGRIESWLGYMEAEIGRGGLFYGMLIAAVVTQMIKAGLRFANEAGTAHLLSSLEGDIRRRIFSQYMDMSYSQVREFRVGDLSSATEQVTYAGNAVIRFNTVVTQVLLLIAYLSVLLWLSWSLASAAITVMLLLSIGLQRITGRIRAIANRLKDATVELVAHTVEFLNGLREIRIFAREDFARARVDEAIRESVATRRNSLVWQATLAPIVEMITVIGIGVILAISYASLNGLSPSSVALVAAFVVVLYRLIPRVSALNKAWSSLNIYLPFVERIAGILNTQDKEYLPDGKVVFEGLAREIRLQDVSLCYREGGREAIQAVSVEIPKGMMIAIVGESGAGKSSLIDLILGLYHPTEGEILVDGLDLRELTIDTWRKRLGVVSQQSFLFNGTITENIAFGMLGASQSEISAAARSAHAHDFILELEDGYQTKVGEQGHRLSGGQRQRIAIARAILRDPDVLILDEATSDLDSESEQSVQEAIEEIRRERTVIVVAHRLSTVRQADEIVVMEAGRIVEQGNHEELLAAGGPYSRFWAIQSGSAGSRS